MSTSLEKIDLIKNRTNVSYSTAKLALEKNNDDLVEALIYLEDNNLIKNIENINSKQKKSSAILKKLKFFLTSYTLVTNRNSQRIFQMQTVLAFSCMIILFWASIPLLLLSLLLKHSWTFVKLSDIDPISNFDNSKLTLDKSNENNE